MSDLEWYLDVGGKQSGPHGAREIVEMVRSGKIPATAHVTAARMAGDWVAAQDLVDAYDELYAKKAVPAPISGEPTFGYSETPANDPNFQAPPRPTEHLERSKIITLNRDDLEKTPDPTEALFTAIQAVREKAILKTSSSTGVNAGGRDNWGQSRAPVRKISPQLLLILTLATIFGITVYGLSKLMDSKTAVEPVAKSTPEPRLEAVPSAPAANSGGGLLNDRGGGKSAARTTPPVRAVPPISARTPPRPVGGFQGGGARYRDERDPEPERAYSDEYPGAANGEEGEVPEVAPPGDELSPVDPSQVPADGMNPDPSGVRGLSPVNPYETPYQ